MLLRSGQGINIGREAVNRTYKTERTVQTQEVIFMADLKTLLGDKYTEDMTIEDILNLEVEEPKADKAAYDSLKKRFDEVASEAAGYKKQLRAHMSEVEQKAAEEAEKFAEIVAERDKLKAEKAIAENSKGLIAIGYDEKLATEVATALLTGDTETVIKAQAKFVDAQKKAVLAEAVKNTPAPPAASAVEVDITKENLRKMSPMERDEFSVNNPEQYKQIYGGS